MITSYLLEGHRATSAAHSSDCCVKSVIHSIVSGIKRKICVPELEQREGFSAYLPSLMLMLLFQKEELF